MGGRGCGGCTAAARRNSDESGGLRHDLIIAGCRAKMPLSEGFEPPGPAGHPLSVYVRAPEAVTWSRSGWTTVFEVGRKSQLDGYQERKAYSGRLTAHR